ncbi:phage portal protein [Terribacillus saccharophilus]|uniref:Phage portal protein n=1 Tax=Terribacillus saccharophilus TaxID=361277 RepID=A0ABX4GTC1_9BACI|nr:phage portal protein [Terribacillus saccharophilus]PAD94358.1 phage portal protein [Terribacillus saccharophilus]PAD98116.1 phage portal protein [Terribacillus saccharophilus]
MGFFKSRSETRSQLQNYDMPVIELPDQVKGLNGRVYAGVGAIKNSDIFTAVHTLASDVAGSPISVMKSNIKDDDTHLFHLLNNKPNPHYSGYFLKYLFMVTALLNGESFVHILRDAAGDPSDLYHRPISDVVTKEDKKGIYYELRLGNKTQRVEASDMLHFRFFTLDGITGISPITSLSYELKTQEASKRLLFDFFKKGTTASGTLTMKGKAQLSREAKDNIREKFEKQFSGASNNQRIIVLNDGEVFEQIQVDTEILKLVNGYTHGTLQIAKAFGLPPHKLGIEQPNTSLEQSNLDYLTNTLSRYFNASIAEMKFKLLPDPLHYLYDLEYDISKFKMTDSKTKRENVTALMQASIYSINDARKEYGKPPIENGDKHLVSLNYTTLDQLEEYQMAKSKNNPVPSAAEENPDLKGGGESGE